MARRNLRVSANLSNRGSNNASADLDVPFPRDYSHLLDQVWFRSLLFLLLLLCGANFSTITSMMSEFIVPFTWPFVSCFFILHLALICNCHFRISFVKQLQAKRATEAALRDNKQLMVSFEQILIDLELEKHLLIDKIV